MMLLIISVAMLFLLGCIMILIALKDSESSYTLLQHEVNKLKNKIDTYEEKWNSHDEAISKMTILINRRETINNFEHTKISRENSKLILKKFGNEIGRKIINNIICLSPEDFKRTALKKINSKADFLNNAFAWFNPLEGRKYWYNLKQTYEQMENCK